MARARGRPATSAPNGPIRRDLSRPKAPGRSCPGPPWRRTSEISAAVDPGAHAVLIVDQAGWHLTPKLAIPDNMRCRHDELNPVENVWQFMRDNWLSNRIFKFGSTVLPS